MNIDVTSVPFLAELPPEGRQAVLAHATVIELAKGMTLFVAGDPADEVYIMLEGKVKLTRAARHQPTPLPPLRGKVTVKELRRRAQAVQVRESLLWLMGPGEMFGELSVFDAGQRSTTATAQTACRVLRISGHAMRDLVDERHDVARALLRQMATRLRRSDNQSSRFILSDVPGRLASLLVSLCDRFGTQTPMGWDVAHDLTQAELAQVVGASRESVNKALTDFEQRGILTVNSRSVVIHDRARLVARSN
ncbi:MULTISPECIES: Crp/Fnr family transcriptional regulator [Aestuariimicrobium]|uniref:Crp/Fnr family transcriptional regulator n=1 Tax=Aestuariimicrobium TaxID=396388 RepID=UPI00047951FC|nr:MULTISPECIES: Crp/Fnr family transcriptional regulator [Aestuariimicrobium]CAI9404721.1 CRP-like cAMP-activated global transcriptional regulator [Aestuariimicrobium sp. T2.26MG-19.2B]